MKNIWSDPADTPITCDMIGEYTVSVADRGWNAYEAAVTVTPGDTVSGVSIANTILHITPDGSGTWTYQWSSSADGITYADIPNATTASLSLPVDGLHTAFYKATAKGADATAIVRMYNNSSVESPGVQAGVSQNAALDVTYATTVSGPVWTYQWYFTPTGGAEEVIPSATTGQYIVQPVDCTRRGTYRVQVNCKGGSAVASLNVNSFGLSSTRFEIVPDNTIGSGDWAYKWYYSFDNASYSPIVPNPGTRYYTLPTGESPVPGTYYMVEATRTGAKTWVRMHHFSDSNPLFGTSVQMVSRESAGLNVTFAAGELGAGGKHLWYFTPNDGAETSTGITTAAYTVSDVDCAKQGHYRVSSTDRAAADPSPAATLLKAGCP